MAHPVVAKGHHNGCGCVSCAILPFSRNNFFTGKFLLERDFTDEQQYLRDKIRHHNQRLHGTGVVCGLEIIQHPNPDCRSRFVRLTPGTAIDCCGNEILVTAEEDIELASLAAIADLDPDDDKLHEIQICLRYKECGNEPVPVLYDECACDDTRCLPNRILESYDVYAVADPEVSDPAWTGPTLVRGQDLAYATASVITALPDGRLLIGDGDTVHLVDPGGAATVDFGPLPGNVFGIELAAGGAFYVTHGDGGTGLKVTVLGTDLKEVYSAAVPDSEAPATTAITSDGRLLLLQKSKKRLTFYDTDLEAGGAPAAPIDIDLAADGRDRLAAHPSKPLVYVAASTAPDNPTLIHAINLDDAPPTPQPFVTLAAGQRPAALLAGKDVLMVVVVDGATAKAIAYDYNTATEVGTAALAGEAVDIAGSPWAFTVKKSEDESEVQAVGLERLAAGRSDAVGPTLGFGGAAKVIAATSTAVYVAYDGTDGAPGGIAVFDVIAKSCRNAWDALNRCPGCDRPDCVVVATIHGYSPGFDVLDADAAADPQADVAAKVARIDNYVGRTRLRSTAVLEAAIDCLMDGGSGGGGPGRPGKGGENGAPGEKGDGLEADLTQIARLSWEHGGRIPLQDLRVIREGDQRRLGLVVEFTKPVKVPINDEDRMRALAEHVFTVDMPNPFSDPHGFRLGLSCRCAMRGRIRPVDAHPANGTITSADVTGNDPSLAIAFILDANEDAMHELIERAIRQFVEIGEDRLPDLAVHINGDFIIDENGLAVDAEFTRAWLPTGDRPQLSQVGIQGGVFKSWFTVGPG
jgi:hypothetical protein